MGDTVVLIGPSAALVGRTGLSALFLASLPCRGAGPLTASFLSGSLVGLPAASIGASLAIRSAGPVRARRCRSWSSALLCGLFGRLSVGSVLVGWAGWRLSAPVWSGWALSWTASRLSVVTLIGVLWSLSAGAGRPLSVLVPGIRTRWTACSCGARGEVLSLILCGARWSLLWSARRAFLLLLATRLLPGATLVRAGRCLPGLIGSGRSLS